MVASHFRQAGDPAPDSVMPGRIGKDHPNGRGGDGFRVAQP